MKLIGPPLNSAARQQGAVLLIALVMLVVITLLAVSGMREVTLESRITGNLLEQKNLLSAAESGLRRGEKTMLASASSPEICTNFTSGHACITDYLNPPTATDIYANFSSAFTYDPLVDKNSVLDRNTRWYVRRIEPGAAEGKSVNSEYGNAMRRSGSGVTHYFEINSHSSKSANADDCVPEAVCIRSAISKTY